MPGPQLKLRLAARLRLCDWHVPWQLLAASASTAGAAAGFHCFKFTTPAFLTNFNFKICDSTLKLNVIGINMPIKLNIQSKFKLNLLQFADSTAAAAQ